MWLLKISQVLLYWHIFMKSVFDKTLFFFSEDICFFFHTPPYNCTHTDWLCLKKRTKSVFWKYNFGQKIEKMKIIDPAFFDFSHFLGKKLEKSKKMGKNVKNAVNWQFLPPNCIFSMDDRWHWGSPSIFSFLNPKKLVFGSKRGNFEN